MRCKFRYVSRLRSGGVAHNEQTVDVPDRRLKVGRGTDNELFLKDLRVNYRHADVVVREHDVVIEAIDGSPLRLDGVPVERGIMTPETRVEVGPYRVQLLPREPDADLALEVELVTPPPTDTVERLIDPRRVSLAGGPLHKRFVSWVLFFFVIMFGLALPILAHRTPDRLDRIGTAGAETEGGGLPLLAGFDRIWISGDLSSSHKSLSDNCGACHENAFVPVRSEACASCHADTEHHFETERFQFAGFTPTDCMDCHTEHQGLAGIVPMQQSLCADCHRDLSEEAPETTLLDAADFGTAHPQFRPAVLVDPASGQTERVALGAPDFPQERSNLRFPHDIHLAETCEAALGATPGAQAADLSPEERQACNVLQMARQRLNDGDGLACGDCHRPEPGGVNMLPVNMRQHCAECHRLEFDPDAPGRVLPHGQPEEVIAVIEDYYAAQVLRAAADTGRPGAAAGDGAGAGASRLRPGAEGAQRPAEAVAAAAAGDPARAAEETAARKLETVFGRSLCGVCHEITPPAESTTGEWEVQPVRVVPLWMQKAQFDHAAHSTTPCADCHAATVSETSGDVLMPGIESCRTCHLGEHARRALPSTCIMCHVYHREDLDPLREDLDPTLLRPVQAATAGR